MVYLFHIDSSEYDHGLTKSNSASAQIIGIDVIKKKIHRNMQLKMCTLAGVPYGKHVADIECKTNLLW